MHGDAPERIAAGSRTFAPARALWQPPMRFGVSAYVVCRDTERRHVAKWSASPRSGRARRFENFGQWVSGTQLEQRLRSRTTRSRTEACARGSWHAGAALGADRRVRAGGSGADVAPVQPQLEEMERFAKG